MKGGGIRVEYSDKDDENLVRYIATYNPGLGGRKGQALYKRLEQNVEGRWPWSERHPWQSWRERYMNNETWFNSKIKSYQQQKGIEVGANGDVRRTRADFSEEDDAFLVQFLAIYSGEHIQGRRGNKVYLVLTENEDNLWPWSQGHPAQSWRNRYVKNAELFDARIDTYRREHGISEPTPLRSVASSSSSGKGKARALADDENPLPAFDYEAEKQKLRVAESLAKKRKAVLQKTLAGNGSKRIRLDNENAEAPSHSDFEAASHPPPHPRPDDIFVHPGPPPLPPHSLPIISHTPDSLIDPQLLGLHNGGAGAGNEIPHIPKRSTEGRDGVLVRSGNEVSTSVKSANPWARKDSLSRKIVPGEKKVGKDESVRTTMEEMKKSNSMPTPAASSRIKGDVRKHGLDPRFQGRVPGDGDKEGTKTKMRRKSKREISFASTTTTSPPRSRSPSPHSNSPLPIKMVPPLQDDMQLSPEPTQLISHLPPQPHSHSPPQSASHAFSRPKPKPNKTIVTRCPPRQVRSGFRTVFKGAKVPTKRTSSDEAPGVAVAAPVWPPIRKKAHVPAPAPVKASVPAPVQERKEVVKEEEVEEEEEVVEEEEEVMKEEEEIVEEEETGVGLNLRDDDSPNEDESVSNSHATPSSPLEDTPNASEGSAISSHRASSPSATDQEQSSDEKEDDAEHLLRTISGTTDRSELREIEATLLRPSFSSSSSQFRPVSRTSPLKIRPDTEPEIEIETDEVNIPYTRAAEYNRLVKAGREDEFWKREKKRRRQSIPPRYQKSPIVVGETKPLMRYIDAIRKGDTEAALKSGRIVGRLLVFEQLKRTLSVDDRS